VESISRREVAVMRCFGQLFGFSNLSAHGHDKHHETTYVSMDTQVQHRMCFKEREIKEK
jgi:hypothetical protein